MTGPLQRTQYRNVATGTVRTGSTGHGESLTDVESYLAPLEQVRNLALLGFGVAQGLGVRAGADGAELIVSPGTAFDGQGRVITLTPGGSAIISPEGDPTTVLHVETVLVPDTGVALPLSDQAAGDLLLTLTWREVQPEAGPAGAVVLVHAPWLRLAPAAGFADSGDQVVLAAVQVAVDAAGAATVTSLTPGLRRQVGVVAGGLSIPTPAQVPGDQPGQPAVGQRPAAELAALPGGGLSIAVHDATAANTNTLNLDGAGQLSIGLPSGTSAARTVHVEGSEVHSGGGGGGFSFADRSHGAFTEVSGGAGHRWVWYAADGTARLWSDRDLLSINSAGRLWAGELASGQLSIGLPSGTSAARTVHVEGSEVHSGGGGGGFSFADRSRGSFTDQPRTSGQRWVWYALDGAARLWSGRDVLSVAFVRVLSFPRPIFRSLVTIDGDLKVSGSISKGGGGFTIDHPLDPAGRQLSHSFVESPEMATLYTGTAETGADGSVEVTLPDYFTALNSDARVHLTAVDTLVPVTASPVHGARFMIRSGEPSVTVNWLVTGVRQDAWAQAHRIEVEIDKDDAHRGSYLHPDVVQ